MDSHTYNIKKFFIAMPPIFRVETKANRGLSNIVRLGIVATNLKSFPASIEIFFYSEWHNEMYLQSKGYSFFSNLTSPCSFFFYFIVFTANNKQVPDYIPLERNRSKTIWPYRLDGSLVFNVNWSHGYSHVGKLFRWLFFLFVKSNQIDGRKCLIFFSIL